MAGSKWLLHSLQMLFTSIRLICIEIYNAYKIYIIASTKIIVSRLPIFSQILLYLISIQWVWFLLSMGKHIKLFPPILCPFNYIVYHFCCKKYGHCVAREMDRCDFSITSGSGVFISLEKKFSKTGTGEWILWV